MEGAEAVRVAPHHFSRLLYANPVCLLTAVSDDGQQCGLMVLSWLTAINNYGLFFASINAGRYTAAVLMAKDTKSFVLSVPVHGMEGLLGRLGKCSSSAQPWWKCVTQVQTPKDVSGQLFLTCCIVICGWPVSEIEAKEEGKNV
eukprot:EG_transcript_43616